jgi:hypothetical protein
VAPLVKPYNMPRLTGAGEHLIYCIWAAKSIVDVANPRLMRWDLLRGKWLQYACDVPWPTFAVTVA